MPKRFPVTVFFTGVALDLILYLISPLEYGSFKFKIIILVFIWISIPGILILMLPRKNSIGKMILVTIGALIYLGFSAILSLGIFLCSEGNRGELYISRTNPSVKIISRSFGCFLTTDDINLYKERNLTENLKWVTSFDEQLVDTLYWKPVERNNFLKK